MADHHPEPAAAAARHLAALAGRDARNALVELRFRRADGPMRQRFYPVARLRQAAHTAVHLAGVHDVYVGCAPRQRRAGGRTAIQRSWVVWAECDTAESSRALADFTPAASLIVRSGSGENRHAYWLLDQPADVDELEALNLRLARAVGADERAYDAARVLRVAGSQNHKHDPPEPVTLERATGEIHAAAAIAAALADIAVDELPRRLCDDDRPRRADDDPLLAISPTVYVQALTGLAPGRDRKVSCPLHADEDPSLHVYETPARGWYCFGCRRGGSIYDLAALLWDRDPRGPEFLALRCELEALFGVRA